MSQPANVIPFQQTRWLNERNTPFPAQQDIPYSAEAEAATIGAVLVDPSAFDQVAALCRAEDFYLLRHAYVWRAIERLMARGDALDLLLLAEELRQVGKLEDIGGPAFLTQLVNGTPTSIYAPIYAGLVRRASLRRAGLVLADEIKALMLNEELALPEAAARLDESVGDLRMHIDRLTRPAVISMRESVNRYLDFAERALAGDPTALGIPTGFRDLDDLLGGLRRRKLYLVGARPGMGKTAFLLGLALNAARAGQRVAFFTFEMTGGELMVRWMAIETGVPTQRVERAQFEGNEFGRALDAGARLSELPIAIVDERDLSPNQIRAKLRLLARENGVDVMFLDYIDVDKMSTEGRHEGETRRQVDYLVENLSQMTEEFNIPIVAAVQLNRRLEQRKDKRPIMSDLRESGKLEQEADVILFLYREIEYNEAAEFPGQADVIVAKNRMGPTGTVTLHFERATTRFDNPVVRRVDLGDFGSGTTHAAKTMKED